jgi:hypothetical protein
LPFFGPARKQVETDPVHVPFIILVKNKNTTNSERTGPINVYLTVVRTQLPFGALKTGLFPVGNHIFKFNAGRNVVSEKERTCPEVTLSKELKYLSPAKSIGLLWLPQAQFSSISTNKNSLSEFYSLLYSKMDLMKI